MGVRLLPLAEEDHAQVLKALRWAARTCENSTTDVYEDAADWSALADRVGAAPEPWLTVDDNGEVVRMEQIRPSTSGTPGFWDARPIPVDQAALYRSVPFGEWTGR